MISAIVKQNVLLSQEILFRPIKKYIEIALKDAGISDIHYVNEISDLKSLDVENVLVILDIVPEISEYHKLIENHQAVGAEISFFKIHSHHHGECEHDILSGIFLTSKNYLLENNFEINHEKSFCEFVEIPESTIVKFLVDVITLNNDFKQVINYHHIENGVFILDTANTYISPDVIIDKDVTILPNTILKGVTSIGEGSKIGPNAMIDTCAIYENVTITNSTAFESVIDSGSSVGPFANLRTGSVIGKDVKIGDFVEIKKAKLGDGTKVSHLTYVGDADVGKNVNIACGTAVANYDGFNKFKTVIGDNAFIGCNTNLIAPVIVEEGSYTGAGSTITDTVDKNSLAIARVKQTNIQNWALNFRNKNK